MSTTTTTNLYTIIKKHNFYLENKNFIINFKTEKFKKNYSKFNLFNLKINLIILFIIITIFLTKILCNDYFNLSTTTTTTVATTTTTTKTVSTSNQNGANNFNSIYLNQILTNNNFNFNNNKRLINNNNNNNNNNELINFNSQFNATNSNDVKKLLEIVMQGLGMMEIPDISKINISQIEYSQKYKEYLTKLNRKNYHNFNNNIKKIYQTFKLNGNDSPTLNTTTTTTNSNLIYFKFPFKLFNYDDIDEANLRLMILTIPQNKSKSKSKFNLNSIHNKLIHFNFYQFINFTNNEKMLLDRKHVAINIYHNDNYWLELNIKNVILNWFTNRYNRYGIEINCDNCHKYGIEFDYHSDNSVINVIGDINVNNFNRIKRSNGASNQQQQQQQPQQQQQQPQYQQHHHLMPSARKKRKTDCYDGNQKCCRHSMEVIFREIKGFEFIIQPKIFDAGYCRGKCPPRYNPAHHHAVLQSLIWKQDRNKAPRPCCAPSKLVELEILHVDEKDSRKLKVSTWNDMRVVECACS